MRQQKTETECFVAAVLVAICKVVKWLGMMRCTSEPFQIHPGLEVTRGTMLFFVFVR